MEKKYKLTEETKVIDGHTLHRIEALRDFGDVKAGDKGGYVESEQNLSHDDGCWVFGDAMVYDEARVFGNAEVYDNARVFGSAEVFDDAKVFGNAKVYGSARVKNERDYIVFKNWWSSGRYFTWTRSNDKWKVGCFHGTGEELIAKAYKDSEESGREYERIVNYVESIKNEINK